MRPLFERSCVRLKSKARRGTTQAPRRAYPLPVRHARPKTRAGAWRPASVSASGRHLARARAEDRRLALVLALAVLLRVARDLDPLALGQGLPVHHRADLLGVEG